MSYDCLLCVPRLDNTASLTTNAGRLGRGCPGAWIGDLMTLLGLGPERIPWTPLTGPTRSVAHLVQPDKAASRFTGQFLRLYEYSIFGLSIHAWILISRWLATAYWPRSLASISRFNASRDIKRTIARVSVFAMADCFQIPCLAIVLKQEVALPSCVAENDPGQGANHLQYPPPARH